ncbi:DNA-directed RNA polymerase subunit beta' [Egicoccus halophilus]|uniref:DNA-directed RNA polymerase subunit beta' n=1 Tax=Egicoccus halophilus TaxID=1670830 RepID=A0A8J3AA16_9ACTN|nr:DNA-directed RNA polymerase subunit beta' [Egicoccus halophilus]GGI05808.1 DNA-directed RNA polymerase subunit beta' [Egicoccus halophilus]
MLDVNHFDSLRISLAEAPQIRMWSNGEVKKPETINYRTLKPEKDGLFCEKIFGPTRDWECYCGKYKRVRFKGIICERCGVEVTRAKVRRERMGHIELAAPVTHIWYLKGVPSRLGYLLDMSPKDLEKVIYFAAYVITSVDDDKRHDALPELEEELRLEKQEIEKQLEVDRSELLAQLEATLAELEAEGAKADVVKKERKEIEKQLKTVSVRATNELEHLDKVLDTFKKLSPKQLIQEELVYRDMRDRFGDYFAGGMGAEAVRQLLDNLDLESEAVELRGIIAEGKGQKKQRATKRLKVVEALRKTANKPGAMVLEAIPVIPPDLRPMVQLDGGRFATSDLNDLYRRVINRNNRLKRLLDLGAPEIIVNNEKRMLQEAVDALFDNGRRGRPVTGPGNRPLKSLSDMLKGKQGRFRQNLLGKRVDYSGRSVIVVGPQLRMHQCGLPKQMALELFKPFVMKRLVDLNYAQNIKSAKRMVERQRAQVWDVLEEVIQDHPVMLNRAPTLHRLGIQAFMPTLVEGKAIQLHPLVCTAFNADFDGDQMAVHLPLSAEAQAEARILMLAPHNILSPATGRPIASPTQDMVLGIYWLTFTEADASAERELTGLPVFSSMGEVERALDDKVVHVQDPIVLRLRNKDLAPEDRPAAYREDDEAWAELRDSGAPVRVITTAGRAIFNEALPAEYPFVNETVTKARAGDIINQCTDQFPRWQVVEVLDAMKDLGYRNATKAGVTIAVSDVETPAIKADVLSRSEQRTAKIEKQFARGVITDSERRQELIEIWTEATAEVADAMEQSFAPTNPFFMMANSGARGNMTQLRQIAAMRGLVANPKGEIIPRPIKANYREGLSVLEFFIATHGARKGLADTALRTADSGYLTRRLVDVSQDLIIREDDCGTDRGVEAIVGEHDSQTLYGRVLARDVMLPGTDEVLMAAGSLVVDTGVRRLRSALVKNLHPETGEALAQPATDEDRVVRVRSVLTCETEIGVCRACYGELLANGAMVDMGEAVGIVAAQSIGEPGTQLTMRTFHTGGVASADDITQGLPRVVELFEARSPRGKAEIARIAGRVEIEETDRGRILRILGARDQVDEHELLRGARLFRADDGSVEIADGASVEVGQQLTMGAIDPHELLEVLGVRTAQLHLVQEVQDVYRSQGVPIHDKHVELIVRQMFRRVNVVDPGDTTFLPGDNIDRVKFKKENDRVLAEGGQPAAGRQMLMGITKASLATDSWLSAASFQETTRVLTEAALESASDPLVGLKENVIIGKLIPAGTGLADYRAIEVGHTEMPEQALPADIAEFLASTESYEGDGSWGFDGGWGFDDFPGDAGQQQ